MYFNYGIAVHGATNVPLHPASHGCIRIPNDLSEGFAGLVEIGDLVYVWDGVKEPEIYGQVIRRSKPIPTTRPDHDDHHDHHHDDHHHDHGGADHRAAGHHHAAGGHHDHPAGDDYDHHNRRPADPRRPISDRSALTPARSGQTSATRRGGADL